MKRKDGKTDSGEIIKEENMVRREGEGYNQSTERDILTFQGFRIRSGFIPIVLDQIGYCIL